MSDAATLGVAAAIALGFWLVVLAVLAVATRAREPHAGPATMELGGDESPGVVNMLTRGWAVGLEAVPATVIDLAARKIVAFERAGPERWILRVPDRGPEGLTPYEQQVYDHVGGLASGGVVPLEALTTGPQDDSAKWWKRFQTAVSADARDRGLSRPRWGRTHLMVLGILAVAPAALAAAAFAALPSHSSPTKSHGHNDVAGFIFVAVVLWAFLMAIPRVMRAERDTPAGQAVAARWLGLRRQLAGDEHFADQPPAAVAIWDRLLAYGAAMGVAPGAVRALPMGAESETQAWTAYGGHWHVVRVHYPARIPPGWGKSPAAAVATGIAFAVPAFLFLYAIGSLISKISDDLNDVARGGAAAIGALIALAFALAPLAALVYGLSMMWSGAADIGKRTSREGLVLRRKEVVRSNNSGKSTVAVYLAVYDGHGNEMRALRCTPSVASQVQAGALVRASVSPRLGYVYSLERLGPMVSIHTGS